METKAETSNGVLHSILDSITVIDLRAYLAYLHVHLCAGDALNDLKIQLNASANQLTDWNINQVNPCTWNSIICDKDNNVISV